MRISEEQSLSSFVRNLGFSQPKRAKKAKQSRSVQAKPAAFAKPKPVATVKVKDGFGAVRATPVALPKIENATAQVAAMSLAAPPPSQLVTVDQLLGVMPNLPRHQAEAYLPHLEAAMREFGIDNPARKAAFLAQLAHESGQLRYFEEIASGAAYEGRTDLGNTQPGDGVRYKGRGPIQLTGRHNYGRAGEALGLDLVGNPTRAADPDVAFRIAGWYWQSRDLNTLADAGDFDGITRRINGGYNGKAARDAYHATARGVFGLGPVQPGPGSGMLAVGARGGEVSRLQSLLNAHGAGIDVDGDFGPMTDRAVRAFQAAHGLEVDGVVGPKTWAALQGGQAPSPAPSAPAPAAPVAGPAPSPSFSGLLARGSSGDEVRRLQEALNARGAGLDVDGEFGPLTEAALRAFQAGAGIGVDGIAGPETFGALGGAAAPSAPSAPAAPVSFGGPMLQQGASGEDVRRLQEALNARGAFLEVDGQFGPFTANAVRNFQAGMGLEVDGVVGPNTWGALGGAPAPSAPVAPAPSAPVAPVASGGGAGGLLQQGARGPEVEELQRLLHAAGVDPGGIDGDFGPATASAVRRFQFTRQLEVDGVVGPQTWGALRANAPATVQIPVASGDVRERILAIARGEIGNVEATNNNDGVVAKYPNFFGRPAQSWCANFVSWVLTHAGIPMNDPWCPSIVNSLKAEGKWKGKSDPQPGDLVLFDWDHDGVSDHVGLVVGVNPNGSIRTIEGNTGHPATGQEGVWERDRWMDTIMGFGNP